MTMEMRELGGRLVKMWQLPGNEWIEVGDRTIHRSELPGVELYPDGEWIEVGDKDDVGREIGTIGKTYVNYVRWKSPKDDPAPGRVCIHPTTRRDLFPMAMVRAWDGRRPGPGDHTGVGAKRRWARVAEQRREGAS